MINTHWPLFGGIRVCNHESRNEIEKIAEGYVESDFFMGIEKHISTCASFCSKKKKKMKIECQTVT